MSDWAFVAAAWTIVWGALAIYAVVLARRVSQAREVARRLRETLHEDGASEASPSPAPGRGG